MTAEILVEKAMVMVLDSWSWWMSGKGRVGSGRGSGVSLGRLERCGWMGLLM